MPVFVPVPVPIHLTEPTPAAQLPDGALFCADLVVAWVDQSHQLQQCNADKAAVRELSTKVTGDGG